MKRALFCALLMLAFAPRASADHITGGEVSYVLLGTSGINYRYLVTVKLYMRCGSGRHFNNPHIISIFDRLTFFRILDNPVPISKLETIEITEEDPCITNPPRLCFEVASYEFEVTLPATGRGYIIVAQTMFRINEINNLAGGYNRVGATYAGEIPGNTIHDQYALNNSARFTGSDLVIVCANTEFSYSFEATDPDGDSLRYYLCDAYETAGVDFDVGNNLPPPPPPYSSVPYAGSFHGGAPMGAGVRIDPNTGIISGVAPPEGIYVVTVCVEERRNGRAIATQRKDIQINVTACNMAAAGLQEEYMVCRDSYTLHAVNLSPSPLISSAIWRIRNSEGDLIHQTGTPSLDFSFPDTGTYQLQLLTNPEKACADSAFAQVRVYPGMSTDFSFAGACTTNTTQFTDRSTTVFGSLTGWEWRFLPDHPPESHEQHPGFRFTAPGEFAVRLEVLNSNGCRDTATRIVAVYDKPPVPLAFRDTLICPPDTLYLSVSGPGVFEWRGPGITEPANPVQRVSPISTTLYHVELDEGGCLNSDSVRVRVVSEVTLRIPAAISICEGDSVLLEPESDALRYTWSPAASLDDPSSAKPLAFPATPTVYTVQAAIGQCLKDGEVRVVPVPYPKVDAGSDTTICFGTVATLRAVSDGFAFAWSPISGLAAPDRLVSEVRPSATTTYVISAYDTKGCAKPGRDTVTVHVRPDIQAFAGRDTAVVAGQPLHLKASGGIAYEWSPGNYLSATDIADPVAIFPRIAPEGYFPLKVRVTSEAGCLDSASLQIRVFSTGPSVFVPSAFTPNGDGRNDRFRYITAGMDRVDLFRVYNRWGQLVHDSPSAGDGGWDGTLKGKALPADTYIWMVRGIDFTGAPYFRKGTVILIR